TGRAPYAERRVCSRCRHDALAQKLEMRRLTQEIGFVRGDEVNRLLQLFGRRLAGARDAPRVIMATAQAQRREPARRPAGAQRVRCIREVQAERVLEKRVKRREFAGADHEGWENMGGIHCSIRCLRSSTDKSSARSSSNVRTPPNISASSTYS